MPRARSRSTNISNCDRISEFGLKGPPVREVCPSRLRPSQHSNAPPQAVCLKIGDKSTFMARRICIETDGSLWAVGPEYGNLNRGEIPDHAVLRHYDAEGRFTHSALPRTMFGAQRHPAQARSSLRCASDRIGFFNFPSNEWLEVSRDGKLLGRWQGVKLDKDTKATGMGLTNDGSVYASTGRFPKGSSAVNGALFRLNKSTGQWTPIMLGDDVLGSDPARRVAFIIGTDGPNLVMHTALPKVMIVKPN